MVVLLPALGSRSIRGQRAGAWSRDRLGRAFAFQVVAAVRVTALCWTSISSRVPSGYSIVST